MQLAILRLLALLHAMLIPACVTHDCYAQARDVNSSKTIRLFNGVNLDGWEVYTAETQFENANVFQVVDGMIYVPGGKAEQAYFGGLISKKLYSNYRLQFEYKWGEKTYGSRKGKARDSGVLLHCVGPVGLSPWMTSYEYQIIEGGTGDLILVNVSESNKVGNKLTLACTARSEEHNSERYYTSEGKAFTFQNEGRLNWRGRDPDWKDEVGFRGRNDVDSPRGEWTKCEVLARGDTLEYYVNAKLVNASFGLNTTKGRVFIQTEGAEIWFRNIQLTPLEGSTSL